MDLKELIRLFRRWFWLLAVCLILGLSAGYLVSKMQTPVYEASTKVLVARTRQQSYNDMLSLDDQQLVMTYLQLLKTRPILEEAEGLLGIKIDPENIQASLIANTQVIEIKVRDKNVKHAVDTANTLVEILIKQNENLQAGRYAVYEEGLSSQIAQVQKQIDGLQNQITQINEENVEEQLDLVNKQIIDLQNEISESEKDIAKFPTVLGTLDRANLAEKQNQINQLRSLLSLYQQIKTNLTFIGQPVQSGGGMDDPRIINLQTTLSLYQQLYRDLLNNLTQTQLARVQSTPTVSQIEAAVAPEKAVSPSPLINMMLSGIVGIVIAMATILLIDYFDDTLKSSQKVQEVLGIPVVGEIAEADHAHKLPTFYSTDQMGDLLLNAFGILRINVSRLINPKSLKTVLVTSPSLGDGKTTIATNLAAAFAQAGKKVILLDGDLYHPALHSRFGIDNQKGLSEILAQNLDWQEVVHDFGEIAVITSGSPSLSSPGLLESDGMTHLLAKLQKRADITIIDGPPLFVVDSQILASKVGGILLVLRQGGTITAIARALLNQLNLMDVNVLGAVLNRVPRADTHFVDGYYHGIPRERVQEKMEEIQTDQA